MRIPRDGAGKAGREAQVGKGGERLEQESGLEKAGAGWIREEGGWKQRGRTWPRGQEEAIHSAR